jgi:hypothetical protein
MLQNLNYGGWVLNGIKVNMTAPVTWNYQHIKSEENQLNIIFGNHNLKTCLISQLWLPVCLKALKMFDVWFSIEDATEVPITIFTTSMFNAVSQFCVHIA